MPAVLFITENFPPQPGGAAVSALRIASAIQASGRFEVHVLHRAGGSTGGLAAGGRSTEAVGGLPVYRLGVPRDTEASLRLTLEAIEHLDARHRYRVFHGFYLLHAGYLATFAARRRTARGTISVVSARGNDVDRAMLRPEQFPMLEWTLRQASAVTCVTTELAEKCTALVPGANAVMIPNSVDSSFFQPLPRDTALLQEAGWEGEAVLGFFGELRAKKGPGALLEAASAALRLGPCRLLLAGGVRESEARSWREWMAAYPVLASHVSETGYITDREKLRALYNACDLVLSPSAYDGMPNAVLEAMACARPVVATDAGGLRDLIRDGSTGFLCSRLEPDAFARRVVEVLASPPEQVAEVGRQAREHVRRCHAPDAERDAYLRLYDKAVTSDE